MFNDRALISWDRNYKIQSLVNMRGSKFKTIPIRSTGQNQHKGIGTIKGVN
jgi:hypothetical protein